MEITTNFETESRELYRLRHLAMFHPAQYEDLFRRQVERTQGALDATKKAGVAVYVPRRVRDLLS